jgi:hypothetical protein
MFPTSSSTTSSFASRWTASFEHFFTHAPHFFPPLWIQVQATGSTT